MEYKINEAAVDFLHMRGVIKKIDLQNYKDDALKIQQSTVSPSLAEVHKENRRSRRSDQSEQNESRSCCCPPAKHMVPTFITDNKFDDVLDTFTSK